MRGTEVLLRLFCCYFAEYSFVHTIARHQKICVSKSACMHLLADGKTPTLNSKEQNVFVVLENNGQKSIQRAVATKSFYGSAKGRYETVLIFGERKEKSFVQRAQNSFSSDWERRLHLYKLNRKTWKMLLAKGTKEPSLRCTYDADTELCVA